mgnify:CR=1 FL=1
MQKKIHAFTQFVHKRKITSGSAAVLLLALGYFSYQWMFGTTAAARFVTAEAQKGTLVASLSATGQVAASTEVQLKSKVSGDAVYVAPNSRDVKAGILLVQLDTEDAQKSVRDAQVNLDSAKLTLQKLQKPAGLRQISIRPRHRHRQIINHDSSPLLKFLSKSRRNS